MLFDYLVCSAGPGLLQPTDSICVVVAVPSVCVGMPASTSLSFYSLLHPMAMNLFKVIHGWESTVTQHSVTHLEHFQSIQMHRLLSAVCRHSLPTSPHPIVGRH